MTSRISRRTVNRWLAASAALPLAARPAWAASSVSVAQDSDVLTLDPTMDTSLIGSNVMTNVFDQLAQIGADGSLQPMLATAWESSADARTWTFTIRLDAKFHDGTPVTLDDVLWSYRRVIDDPKSPVRVYMTKVATIEALPPDKLRFTLTEAYQPFVRQALLSVVPRHAYEAMGPARFGQTPIGSGPYRVVRWVKDDVVQLAANPAYWGGAPKIAEVLFKPIPNESARAAALSSGEIDVAALPPALIDRIAAQPELTVKRVGSFRVIYIGIDTNNPILKNLAVRQAIDCGVDREAITSKLLKGFGTPIGEMVAPVTNGYDPAIKPTQFDPRRARDLLRSAGYRGEKIPLQYPTNRYAMADQVAQAVAGYLTAIGMSIDLQGLEYAALFPLWLNRKLNGLHLWAFGPSVMDADLVLTYLYAPGGSGYWDNPEVDQLITAQRAEIDPAKRLAEIGRIWQLSQDNVAFSPLYSEVQAWGIRKTLDWQPRPDGRLLFGNATII